MKKHRVEYNSSLDALVALAKRLSSYESKYKITSEEFFNNLTRGLLEDSEDYIEWANDYQHYVAVRQDLEELLRNVA
ncbi:MAG: hypothetical protein U9P10_02935 [Thermodesulfobacteriota bacterium]|nr:hypothetical protein [Thermodesulfobacteriota bacterium]